MAFRARHYAGDYDRDVTGQKTESPVRTAGARTCDGSPSVASARRNRSLSGLRAETGDAFACPDHPRGGHLCAGHFLDLAGGASAVIDLNSLTEPQAANVLLARDPFGQRGAGESSQDQHEQ